MGKCVPTRKANKHQQDYSLSIFMERIERLDSAHTVVEVLLCAYTHSSRVYPISPTTSVRGRHRHRRKSWLRMKTIAPTHFSYLSRHAVRA